MQKKISIKQLDSALNNREFAKNLLTLLQDIGQIPRISEDDEEKLLDKYLVSAKQ